MLSSYADMYLVSRGAAVRTSLTTAAEARRRRFEQIYAANHAAITGYVLRRTDNPDDAADVIAETFLACWRRLADVPDGGSTRLWLYGVARRVLANHHRAGRRRTALADRLRADLTAAYRAREYSGELATITAAFRSLPAADQELLALAAWERLTTGQIAAVLGCSPNAVRIRRLRARRRFTALLASDQAARSIDGHVANGDLA
jgi:RNA polymerase sigma factor (sigma-70 family)